jgi:CPA1 family monovalent cation:H+ antiporter
MFVGLFCSWLARRGDMALLPRLHLTENLTLFVFLPPLVFDAALSLDVKSLKRNLVPILTLAAPGVVFATVATGALVHWLTPLAWGPAMLFGALISATDTVAVLATFKEVKAPERLATLVDGESLFNDATVLVVFGIIAGLVASGSRPDGSTLIRAGLQFAGVFVGGFVVGALIGWMGMFLIRLGRDAHATLGVLFSICAAYGSFIVAQGMLGLSGVMAAVGAGMVVAGGLKREEDSETLRQIREFWPIACFFANSLIFLLLGITQTYLLDLNRLADCGFYLLIASLTVLAVRAAMVYGFVPITNAIPGQEPVSRPYRAVMLWGGMRGALPIGLAAGILPENLGLADMAEAQNQQKLIVLFTVAVVIFTLLAQGTTLGPLMARLGLAEKDKT